MKIKSIIAISATLLSACGDYAPWPVIGSKLSMAQNKTQIESTIHHDKFILYQSGTALYVTCDKDGSVVAVWSAASNSK